MDDSTILAQLDQARELAFSNRDVFPQVVKQILNLVSNPSAAVQRWCSVFLKQAFSAADSHVSPGVKVDLAIDALPALKVLANVWDLDVFKNAIDVSILVFKLTFRYVAENDGSSHVWSGVNDLKNELVAKFDTQFPFESTFDKEHDSLRNIDAKLELLKFVVTVVDYQSRSVSSKHYSLARINPNHTLIKPALMESEAAALVDVMLRTLQNDILVTPLVTATLNHLAVLVRRKRQYMDKIVPVLESLDTTQKLQSNYESLETFKLSRKYVDRTLRVLLGYMVKCQVVPPKYQAAVSRKLSVLTARGDEIRKKNILLPSPEDSAVRKRKLDGFENSSKKLRTVDYKHLYCLTDPANELNNFDLSTVSQNILVTMALTALNKVDSRKLSKALEIISDRYLDAVKDLVPTAAPQTIKQEDDNEDDDEAAESYNPETTFTLPPPKLLSFQEKKDHVALIIRNFFALANTGKPADDELQAAPNGISKELTKVAIQSWRQDSWVLLLTRLATRGLHTVDSESADGKENSELSDMVRRALFDHFLEKIHERVDLVIEWLNEEWYSEKVVNEQKARDEIREKWFKKYEETPNEVDDVELQISKEVEALDIPTPRYNEWGQKVLDAMIPFLEPTDRKIFLRLLSDLPTLTPEMVHGIKSLCQDPARTKLGFLSLQFLMMYRPPAKPACLDVLRELAEGDQEDLKEEAQKLLTKYA
ncbi:putative RNA-processing protein [Clavispora lusitaniae]|uniref:RNA-processing protein n=1 Tax=Clavispora lusitaniae TaxID=36911 RepID=A0AA91T2I2_CLALS|nr:putative RNA-processing protein [Clavispora lusitaniae]